MTTTLTVIIAAGLSVLSVLDDVSAKRSSAITSQMSSALRDGSLTPYVIDSG